MSWRNLRFVRSSIAALSVAVALTACSRPATTSGRVVLNRGNGPDIKSLDPAFIDGTWENLVIGDLLVGLVTEDAKGQPIPGAALSWTVSPDGLTWTFHLRHATWSDGVPVTAADFVTAWQREMDPKTGAVYAYILWPIKNAQAISDGKLPPSSLGVKAIGTDVLEVHLEHPAPYMLQLMEHEAAYPIPRHVYEKYGAGWTKPGHFVGNGPYLFKEWVPLDHITLVKNPHFYDARDVQIDVVNYYVTNDSEAALKRYRAGELDTIAAYPALEADWLRSHMQGQIRSVPMLSTTYLIINFRDPLLKDDRLREVLNLVYNRRQLVRDILRLGQPPAYSLVPPGIANYPHTVHLNFSSQPYNSRLLRAQALMRQMGYGPDHPLHLKFLTATNPDTVRIAAVMQSMYAKAYIDIEINAEERQAQIVDMQQGNFQLGDVTWSADFNDASNYLDLLLCGSQENLGQYCNPRFDSLMAASDHERNAASRGALMAEAEQLALDDNALVPIYFGVTQELVKPYVKGWIANPVDVNRTRWLRIEGVPAR